MATIHSFFIPEIALKESSHILIEKNNQEEIFYQLSTVFRAKKGMHLYVLDNLGSRALCEIQSIEKKSMQLFVLSISNKEKPLPKTLWLPVAKPATIELIIRMCTEVGITEYRLFRSNHSNEKYENKLLSQNQLRRFRQIAQEAAEQSEHFYLPEISSDIVPLDSIQLSNKTLVMIERMENTILTPSVLTSLLIGPEGGFSQQEKERFASNNVTTLSFNSTVLKVETAAVIGSAHMCLY